MKKEGLISIILVAALIVSCSKRVAYEKVSDGVVVRLKKGQTKAVKVRVFSDEIIQVVATPVDTFSTSESLVVLAEVTGSTDWKIEESENEVTLVTSKIKAHISLLTGDVSFRDLSGKVILDERKEEGRTFTPVTVGGEKSYYIRQVYESPSDEAFYGLGGHQNGQMNYKGQDVELAQHNIVDVVPFLYSSKNYGILWDNYSISKFGDPRDYQPLNTVTLFTKDGKPGGLTADYYVRDKVVKQVVEDKIEYEFLETPQVDNFPNDVSRHGKVVWEGSFTSELEGDHKFLVYSSGYIKVWIDGNLTIDKWRQNWNPWTNKFTVDHKKGEKHSIKIEWTPDDH